MTPTTDSMQLFDQLDSCLDTARFAAICRGAEEWQNTTQGAALTHCAQSMLIELKTRVAFLERLEIQNLH